VRELVSHQDKLLDLYYDDGVFKENLQAQQHRLATEQAQAQRLADAGVRGQRPGPSARTATHRRAAGAVWDRVEHREAADQPGDLRDAALVGVRRHEIQPAPLYADLGRKLGRDAAQSSGNRPEKDRGPDFRGHGLKRQEWRA
jgi:hypothetical protein